MCCGTGGRYLPGLPLGLPVCQTLSLSVRLQTTHPSATTAILNSLVSQQMLGSVASVYTYRMV